MSAKMAIKLRKFGRVCPITGYNEESIKVGAPVIVQTDRGVEFGQIVQYERGLPKRLATDVRLKKVLRYATDNDLAAEKELTELENKAKAVAVQKYREHDVPIKNIDVEYLFDKNRAIFYYKLEDQNKSPNLRDLRTDLAKTLQVKADLRQLSPRDEAMMVGGLGPCGRKLCCVAWLEKPRHVSVKAVKEQGLQISPTKTSGMCGRLFCCLDYEAHAKEGREGPKK
jgi:cell fate regulator YaaT (PSP1 superfamily)